MFGRPAAGVVTKTDLAGPGDIEKAGELLCLAGASPLFEVSCLNGAGMDALKAFLSRTGIPNPGLN
jgi:ethanolamine utilization protein EutP (predicted NTPase)